MKSNLFKYFPYLYLIILMISYILGNAVIDLCVILSGLSWLVIYRKNFFLIDKQINSFFILLFLFYFILIFSSLFSEYSSYALLKSSLFIRFILFGLFFYEVYNSSLNKFSKYFELTLYLLIFIYFDLILQLVRGKDIFGFEYISADRLSGPFGNELILGNFIFIFGSLYVLTKKKYDLFFYFNLLLITTAIAFTGERIAFIKFNIFIILLLYYTFFKNKEFKKIKILSSLLIIILYTYFLILNKTTLLDRHSQFIEKFIPGTNNFILYNGYYAHYTTAINIFIENPILGSGFRTFRKNCKKYENYFNKQNIPFLKYIEGEDVKETIEMSLNRNICTTHPHNFYLELLSETGLLGLLSFLLILYFAYRILCFYETKFFFIVYFIPFLSTTSIFHGKNSFLFIFILLSLIFIDREKKSNKI